MPHAGPNGEPETVGMIGPDGEWELFGQAADDRPAGSLLVDSEADLPELPVGRSRRFLTIDQLGEARPIEWLVPGWIAAGELSVLYGQGDSYKSFIVLHWGLLAAAAGRDVIYIAGEGAHGLRSRVPAWMRLHGYEASDLPGFRVDEMPLIVDDDRERSMWLTELEDELGKDRPDWIIIDTLAMCFAGDENTPSDMNKFVKGCEHIRRGSDSRSAVTVVHHMGVTTGRERGTAALRNATFSMAKTDHKGTKNLTVVAEVDRMKDAEKPAKVRAVLEEVAWTNDRGESVSSLAVREFEEMKLEEAEAEPDATDDDDKIRAGVVALCAVLRKQKGGEVGSTNALVKLMSGDTSRKRKVIRQAVADGLITEFKNGPGKGYRIEK